MLSISVILITRNEKERLRLTLASLERQTVGAPGQAFELVVVDDGSTDGTRQLLEESKLPVVRIHSPHALGPAEARNAGVRASGGELLIFLDGDVLAGPDLIAKHRAVHEGAARALGRGETHHLRCTRFFQDPETGAPIRGQEAEIALLGQDLSRHLVTLVQVLSRFREVESRAEAGIYPGRDPQKLYSLEMRALRTHPPLSVSWMAASGHNASLRRRDFDALGGFDPLLTDHEHHELAFRHLASGGRVAVVPARSYQLAHGGPAPLVEDQAWERIFLQKHPCLAVKLMSVFWQSLAHDPFIPKAARITSLERMEELVQSSGGGINYDVIRRAHPQLRQTG